MALYEAYLQNLGLHQRTVAVVKADTEDGLMETDTVKLLGSFEYETVEDVQERNSVLFHLVRELLYKAGITDLHLVKILDPTKALPPVVPDTPDVGRLVVNEPE